MSVSVLCSLNISIIVWFRLWKQFHMAAENRAAHTVLVDNIWKFGVTLPKEETVKTYLLLGL